MWKHQKKSKKFFLEHFQNSCDITPDAAIRKKGQEYYCKKKKWFGYILGEKT